MTRMVLLLLWHVQHIPWLWNNMSGHTHVGVQLCCASTAHLIFLWPAQASSTKLLFMCI